MAIGKTLLLELAVAAMILVTIQERSEFKRKGKVKGIKFYNKLSKNKQFSNKSHPCDLVNAKEFEYGVKSCEGKNTCVCKRYTEDELLNRMNCSGTFNSNYLAVTREQARRLPNLAKRKRRHAMIHSKPTRHTLFKKRLRKLLEKSFLDELKNTFFTTADELDDDEEELGYGEIKVYTENCLARWSLDGVKKRPCGVCPTLTRQPQSPSRFPEYLNGLRCHPNETQDVEVDGQTIGTCIQETVTMELVERTGQWEEDSSLTAKNGVTTYVEKWNAYDQEINSTCSFSFYQ